MLCFILQFQVLQRVHHNALPQIEPQPVWLPYSIDLVVRYRKRERGPHRELNRYDPNVLAGSNR